MTLYHCRFNSLPFSCTHFNCCFATVIILVVLSTGLAHMQYFFGSYSGTFSKKLTLHLHLHLLLLRKVNLAINQHLKPVYVVAKIQKILQITSGVEKLVKCLMVKLIQPLMVVITSLNLLVHLLVMIK